MCLIIDTNALHLVFNTSSKDHKDFEPILNWVMKGNGSIVYGGTKYFNELTKTGKYLKIFKLLNSMNKAKIAEKEKVDEHEKEVKKIIKDKKFNDAHLVALVRTTNCRIICSQDSNSYPFLTDKSLYPKSVSVPKLYTQLSNKTLLNKKYISDFCNPCEKINKEKREAIKEVMQ